MKQPSPTSSDPSTLTNTQRHELQQFTMTIVAKTEPFANIVRIQGKIDQLKSTEWCCANVALRLLFTDRVTKASTSRVYTARSFDPHTATIEIDLVKHAGASPAMDWLNTVQIGDVVHAVGPRPHFTPNFSLGKHVVMFADDTAIPAVYSILQQWQHGISADLYIESFDTSITEQFPQIDQVNIHFFHKTEQHVQGLLLQSALQHPNYSNTIIWAACERNEARALREFFLDDQYMNKNEVDIAGYWKAGVSSAELDQIRAQHYLQHTKQGKSLAEYDDLDMPG